MEYEGCYVFQPREDRRPAKRRRTETHGLQTSWPIRRKIYEKLWGEQAQKLRSLLRHINEATVADISSFVENSSTREHSSRIPSAIISAGPSLASHTTLFNHLSERITKSTRNIFVSLTSNASPNLKTLLKTLIYKGTSSESYFDDEDEDAPRQTSTKRRRLLNYDLQILHDWVAERETAQVVVAFQDCEAFDGSLLSDTIELLGAWRDRIPFVLLFGVATSVENFQSKLTRKAAKCISGRQYDVVKAESALEQVFSTIHNADTKLWLGPGLCTSMVRRQGDHVQSLDAFADSIKYAYMTSFYANPLSIFLDSSLEPDPLTATAGNGMSMFNALRSLPSFQSHVTSLIEQRRTPLVRYLLDDDSTLFSFAKEQIAAGQQRLVHLLSVADLLRTLQPHFPTLQQLPRSQLIIDALACTLKDSPYIRTLLLCIRKAPSNVLETILQELLSLLSSENDLHSTCTTLQASLRKLVLAQNEGKSAATPLRSEYDISSASLRTTVVAKKVELSKQKSRLTKGDAEYTSLLRQFSSALETLFANALIDPKALVFNEIFVYDLRSPNRDVFTPKPRFAVERALTSPHDYLDCVCCAPNKEGGESSLSPTQPAAAILYQLYLESGAIINTADLRLAFTTILGGDEVDEKEMSALFQQSLAQLQYLGLMKATKKKVDHVLKLAWKGL